MPLDWRRYYNFRHRYIVCMVLNFSRGLFNTWLFLFPLISSKEKWRGDCEKKKTSDLKWGYCTTSREKRRSDSEKIIILIPPCIASPSMRFCWVGKLRAIMGSRRSSFDGSSICNRSLAALTSDGYSDYAHKLFVDMRQKVNISILSFWCI